MICNLFNGRASLRTNLRHDYRYLFAMFLWACASCAGETRSLNQVSSNTEEVKEAASPTQETKESSDAVRNVEQGGVMGPVSGDSQRGHVPETKDVSEKDQVDEKFQSLMHKVSPLSSEKVVDFFRNECASCHASGAAYASFWSADFAMLNEGALKSDPQVHVVYQSLVNSIFPAQMPKPMPMNGVVTSGSALESSILGVLKWFLETSPDVAKKAYAEFDHVRPFKEDVKVNYDFTCNNPITFRRFLTRFTLDAFGRLPSERDFKLFPEFPVDQAVSKKSRQAVASSLTRIPEWREEFLNHGLRNFADKLSGVDDIKKNSVPDAQSVVIYDSRGDRIKKTGLNQDEVSGLVEEFYQLLLGNIDRETGKEKRSYRDLLLGDQLFVNRNTRFLYNCSIMIEGDDWKSCDISAASNGLRSSYFTSFSYLASRTSSFLADNNNYSRVSTLYQFISGSPLQAATDGPTGGAIDPLPSCLKSKDTRGHLVGSSFAPTGSIQIPHSGNVCQSCHIGRNLAAGSIVFRPFGYWGQIMTAANLKKYATDVPGVNEALKAVRRGLENPMDESSTTAVDVSFLASLLPDSDSDVDESACVIVDGKGVEISSVKELAEILIDDGKPLAVGLARHIPRSISNIGETNSELLATMQAAFESSGGELLPVFQSYFESETFSCENKTENPEVLK